MNININTAYQMTSSELKIAYRMRPALASHENAPTIVFIGGYASDMQGSKASALDEYCRVQGYGFLRFDYRGHGESDGEFLDFGIGDWIDDAKLMIETHVQGPALVIGSSMGGWIALKLTRDWPEKFVGLIGIAAAPDFTEDSFWQDFSEEERARINHGDYVERPSGYDEPYRISPHLITQGRENLILRTPLALPMPVRLFQGLDDQSVSTNTALRLANHADCQDLRLTLVKIADHSFARPEDLSLIFNEIEAVFSRV